jgi:hypothetical protein
MDKKQTQQNNHQKPVITDNSQKPAKKTSNILFYVVGIGVLVLAGIGTGYALNKSINKGVTVSETGAKIIKTEKVVGLLQQNFSDSAEGMLEEGGIEGEGTHHLVREGGPSQNVYLTSSVVNMNDYTGKKVKVWGETNTAQKAGWLMDVGRLELLE